MKDRPLTLVQDDDEPCTICGEGIAIDEGACADCINDINGQFGVGA